MANHPHDKTRPESEAVRRALEAGDMHALGQALSIRQLRFCEEYVVDFNGAAAAVRAGYSKRYPDRQAGQLMMNEGVKTYITHLTRQSAEAITTVDRDYIVQKTLSIANREGARDGDKLRGLEFLAKLLGLLIDRTEITGKDGEAIQLEQKRAIEEEADAFLANLKQLQRRADAKKDVNLI